jgi:hypothetical protein
MGHHALPAGFAPHQFPRGSNYLMISKSTMDHRNHSHGSQTICKQYKYWEEPKKQQYKVSNYTSPGIRTTAIKEASAEARDIEATERRTIESFPQENPESTTRREKTC